MGSPWKKFRERGISPTRRSEKGMQWIVCIRVGYLLPLNCTQSGNQFKVKSNQQRSFRKGSIALYQRQSRSLVQKLDATMLTYVYQIRPAEVYFKPQDCWKGKSKEWCCPDDIQGWFCLIKEENLIFFNKIIYLRMVGKPTVAIHSWHISHIAIQSNSNFLMAAGKYNRISRMLQLYIIAHIR